MKSKFSKVNLPIFILIILLGNAYAQIPFLPLENPTDKPLPAETTFKDARKHPITGEIKPHNGIDIQLNSGDPIYAADGGNVKFIPENESPTAGWFIEIDHGNGIVTRYLHLQEKPNFNVNDKVTIRQQIGKAGSTGLSTGPHLHFEVIVNGKAVDPLPHLLYWEKTKPEIITVSLLPPGESNLLSMAVARDPNAKYGPQGYVTAGQTLNYTVEFENEGEGIA